MMTRFGGLFDSRSDETVYVSDGFGRIGEGRRVRRPDPFGRVLPDKRFDGFRKAWQRDRDPFALLGDRPFAIDGDVGVDADNRREDVAKLETGLGVTGHLDLDRTEGPTGYPSTRLVEATKRFQRDHGLKVDGLVTPGGPTIRALESRVGQRASPAARAAGERGASNLLARSHETEMLSDSQGGSEIVGETQIAGVHPILGLRRQFEASPTNRSCPVPSEPWPSLPPQPDGAGDRPRHPGMSAPDEPASPFADGTPPSEAIADEFVKEVMKPVFSHPGDATTQKGNNIVAKECRAVLNEDYPDIADRIVHVAGANQDGKDRKLPERRINRPGAVPSDAAGSSLPDLTWEDTRRGEDDPSRHAHANTMTQGKRGKYTAKENRSFDSLEDKVGSDLATRIPKLRPGMNEDEYRKMAKEKCREIFGKWLGRPTTDKGGA